MDFAEVGIYGFQAVQVTDDDTIAKSGFVILGISDNTIESGYHGIAGSEVDVEAMVLTAPASFVSGIDSAIPGHGKLFIARDQREHDFFREMFIFEVVEYEGDIIDPVVEVGRVGG